MGRVTRRLSKDYKRETMQNALPKIKAGEGAGRISCGRTRAQTAAAKEDVEKVGN